MKRLYVSDLDGTLLGSDGRLGDRSAAILAALLQNGLPFTVSTARSPVSVRMVGLERLSLPLPVSLLNGAMLYDLTHDRVVDTVPLPCTDTVIALCEAAALAPRVFRAEAGRLTIDCTPPKTPEERRFIEERQRLCPSMFRLLPVHRRGEGAVFISVQGRQAQLAPIYASLSDRTDCRAAWYPDNYLPGVWFLEVTGPDGGKDGALRRLKRLTGAEAVTVFGDNRNDLALFAAADEAIAVANAVPELRAAADRVIGANDDDGVAFYLKEVYRL